MVSDIKIKPFVKWVGGKRQLLSKILDLMPKDFNKYYEPFVGGGAVLLNLIDSHGGNLHGRAFDINEELINVYETIKTDVSALIKELKTYKYDKDFFLEIRGLDRLDGFKNFLT